MEKAFALACILRRQQPDEPIEVLARGDMAIVKAGGQEYGFESEKGLEYTIHIKADGTIEEGNRNLTLEI